VIGFIWFLWYLVGGIVLLICMSRYGGYDVEAETMSPSGLPPAMVVLVWPLIVCVFTVFAVGYCFNQGLVAISNFSKVKDKE
jgi:hypothetical protein